MMETTLVARTYEVDLREYLGFETPLRMRLLLAAAYRTLGIDFFELDDVQSVDGLEGARFHFTVPANISDTAVREAVEDAIRPLTKRPKAPAAVGGPPATRAVVGGEIVGGGGEAPKAGEVLAALVAESERLGLYTSPRGWWADNGEISRLLRWLHDVEGLNVDRCLEIVSKPWNWTAERDRMLAAEGAANRGGAL